MNSYPMPPDSIARINHELSRVTPAEYRLSLAETRTAYAISDACTTFRRVREDLDDYIDWLETHSRDLAPLIRLLTQIADAVCRARSGSSC